MPFVAPVVGAAAAAFAQGAAIAGGITAATAATIGAVVGSVVTALVSFAATAIGNKRPSERDPGIDAIIREPISPRRRQYGRGRVGGTLVHGQLIANNKRLLLIAAVSEGPVRGPVGLYFGDEKVWERTGSPANGNLADIGTWLSGWQAYAYAEFYDGSQTAASTYFVNASSVTDRPTTGNVSQLLSPPSNLAVTIEQRMVDIVTGEGDTPAQVPADFAVASWDAPAGTVTAYRITWAEKDGTLGEATVDGATTSYDLGGHGYVDVASAQLTVAAKDSAGNWTDAVNVADESAEREQVWGSDRIGTGVAYIALDLTWDAARQRFPSGIPAISVELEGARDIKDPRDSEAESYSRNAALVLRHYITDPVCGIGAPLSEVQHASWTARANLADEDVTLEGGGSEPRYEADGLVRADEDRLGTVAELGAATAGDVIWSEGVFKPVGGEIPAPVLTLTDDDLLVFPPPGTFDRGIDQAYNTVKGAHAPRETDYVPVDYPAQSIADYVTEDGGTVFKELPLPYTQSVTAAQRLARIALREGRKKIALTLTAPFWALKLEPGDTIIYDSDYFGWGPRYFAVVSSRIVLPEGETPRLGIELEVTEANPLAFQWNASDAIAQSYRPRTDPPRVAMAPPTDVALTVSAHLRADGAHETRAVVTWTASPDPAAIGYDIRYSLDGFEETARVAAPATRFVALSPIRLVSVRAAAPNGIVSAWVPAADQGFAPSDTTAPATPANWSVSANALGQLVLSGDANTELDFKAYRVYTGAAGDAFGAATFQGEFAQTQIALAGLAEGVERRVWITAVDRSGNESAEANLGTATPSAAAVGQDGPGGPMIVTVFKRAATQPSGPSGGTVNFTTGAVTPPSGWTVGVPAADGNPAWSSTAVVVPATPGATAQAIVSWSSVTKALLDGDSPQVSIRITVFKRASSQPSTPSGGSFNVATGVLTPPSGWSIDDPGGSNPLWSSAETFTYSGTSGTVSGGTWSTPVKTVEDGTDGLNATLQTELRIYRNSDSGAPGTPSGGTYDFDDGSLSSVPSGWSRTPSSLPSGESWVRYVSVAFPSATLPTTTDSSLSWSAPAIDARNGADGADGADGSAGNDGARGAGRYYINVASLTQVDNASEINSKFLSGTGLIAIPGDQAIFYTGTASNHTGQKAWIFDGPLSNDWTEQEAFVDGNLLVAGTITGDKIDTDDLIAKNIRTSTSGARVDINNYSTNKITIFDQFGSVIGTFGQTNQLFGDVLTVTADLTAASGRVVAFDGGFNSGPYLNVRNTSSNTNSMAILASSGASTSGKIASGDGYAFKALSGTAGPFTGSHEALLPRDAEIPEPGDIVVDIGVVARRGIDDTVTEIALAREPRDPRAIGVVTFRPLDMSAFDDASLPVAAGHLPARRRAEIAAGFLKMAVNGVGEGQINVCGLGGEIRPGDLIVTSAMPGKGMRQADDLLRACTVARAREGAAFAAPDAVATIACIYLCG
ncbi:hypothetical protein LNKW23_17890 [Paralimibaculum aggregatum]|uniref:Tip attachment protein J domain-containing protein n=1 Tax=Paralimibaculum aggregatum TaxID=3036245 RepID=A0ABQ6LH06_9RHOB|nr:phage tail protein [Limibaculum sp. NKW23]GMG82576.1 hypothetical protein LNKW23_17890 [Limibaculum sp. NKW23]